MRVGAYVYYTPKNVAMEAAFGNIRPAGRAAGPAAEFDIFPGAAGNFSVCGECMKLNPNSLNQGRA